MKLYISSIKLDQDMIYCDFCHKLLFTSSDEWQEANETQHICNFCYGRHQQVTCEEEGDELVTLERYEPRIGKDARPYRYYFNPPKVISRIPKE